MDNEILEVLRHIFQARIDNAVNNHDRVAWGSARDIVEYAVAGNMECLRQFDYLMTNEDKEEAEISMACERESLGNNWW